eukprot:366192-Chlamydomonas_euryale.AAC.6
MAIPSPTCRAPSCCRVGHKWKQCWLIAAPCCCNADATWWAERWEADGLKEEGGGLGGERVVPHLHAAARADATWDGLLRGRWKERDGERGEDRGGCAGAASASANIARHAPATSATGPPVATALVPLPSLWVCRPVLRSGRALQPSPAPPPPRPLLPYLFDNPDIAAGAAESSVAGRPAPAAAAAVRPSLPRPRPAALLKVAHIARQQLVPGARTSSTTATAGRRATPWSAADGAHSGYLPPSGTIGSGLFHSRRECRFRQLRGAPGQPSSIPRQGCAGPLCEAASAPPLASGRAVGTEPEAGPPPAHAPTAARPASASLRTPRAQVHRSYAATRVLEERVGGRRAGSCSGDACGASSCGSSASPTCRAARRAAHWASHRARSVTVLSPPFPFPVRRPSLGASPYAVTRRAFL